MGLMITAEQIRHALLDAGLALRRTGPHAWSRGKDPAVALAEMLNRQPVKAKPRRSRMANRAEGIAVPILWKGQ